MTAIRFTSKQIQILSLIKAGNVDGSPCSVYDLMDNLIYECKRDALLHSIKILVDNGFVERRDTELRKGRAVRVFFVTTKALDYL